MFLGSRNKVFDLTSYIDVAIAISQCYNHNNIDKLSEHPYRTHD